MWWYGGGSEPPPYLVLTGLATARLAYWVSTTVCLVAGGNGQDADRLHDLDREIAACLEARPVTATVLLAITSNNRDAELDAINLDGVSLGQRLQRSHQIKVVEVHSFSPPFHRERFIGGSEPPPYLVLT